MSNPLIRISYTIDLRNSVLFNRGAPVIIIFLLNIGRLDATLPLNSEFALKARKFSQDDKILHIV